jgi:hypothetical protein
MAMRKSLWLIPISFLLYACPYESSVPLEKGPVEPIDSSLIGYWYGIVKDGSDFFGIEALDITKNSDSTYAITRYGKAAKGDIILPDTSYFTGYISRIGEQRFMNIKGTVVIVTTRGNNKPPEVTTQDVYYLSAYNTRHDSLDVQTITENFTNTRKGFKSPEELKQVVSTLLQQQKNIYDDLYILSYHKIPKPQPLKGF